MADSNDQFRHPITAHDVARLAGVSQSAVSRTFTKGASVSAKTRQKVEEAASTLGYRPNQWARSLIKRRSNLIGVVAPSMENPFYSAVLEALSAAFEELGYRVLLFSTANHEDCDPILEEILGYRVEALVLVSASLSSRFAQECKQTGLPVVLVNRRNDSCSVSSVTSDNAQGSLEIAQFLVAGNHRQLAYIAGKESSSTSRDREIAFIGELERLGHPMPQREIGHYTFNGAMSATRRLLSGANPPDGIFCANDIMALAAINVAREEFGLALGRDISIIGFDDISIATWPTFSLTTYVQPVSEMVNRAVGIICAQLENPDTPAIQVVVRGQLIVRKSSKIPESW
ncbi:LacI family DNA-binding transcriptional regulator [Pseudomonas gingeri]|uniref:LacI family DNA-binding transcriptional regulator n=1 Tax=Pseudomonas gingeri TaxID=117681 RepID=UPI0015A1675F|nr:LacI family DNA-binding transcriptional regulator [Pseudomonas gingeri]NWD04162.1 LacI family DNA-binding transcriptional regulator [Pseudomonas gingeri]NWE34206.1 LacI family DNA-binding transcriptional regulator [Pseudomonas gingeri]NWE56542.1 LacI family DNA-binding transcriptional regulator [Pseudomonas gingeri]NWF05758.1 LacI family DNA-binding transcriptional regulator [Pseudomonas gingeri]